MDTHHETPIQVSPLENITLTSTDGFPSAEGSVLWTVLHCRGPVDLHTKDLLSPGFPLNSALTEKLQEILGIPLQKSSETILFDPLRIDERNRNKPYFSIDLQK